MKHYAIGTEVWCEDTYGNIVSGIVSPSDENIPNDYICLKGTRDTIGTFCVQTEKCYPSLEKLKDAIQTKNNAKITEICENIQTVEDLIRYMYDHTVSCAEEYTDWVAREAVAKRASELLGIDLNANA